MAKSSPEEMEQMLAFFNGLEAIFDGEFEMSPFDDYDMAQEEAVGKYVVAWWEKFLDVSWGRFYWGFDTLLRSMADPDLNYLEWNPEIKAVLDAHEAKMERFCFTAEQIAEAVDTWANFTGFSGETVVLAHGNTWQTHYAHMSRVDVACGDYVNRGQIIGAIGRTGAASVPHLHFIVRSDGLNYDPLRWLP